MKSFRTEIWYYDMGYNIGCGMEDAEVVDYSVLYLIWDDLRFDVGRRVHQVRREVKNKINLNEII
jgi:hypothetical protein